MRMESESVNWAYKADIGLFAFSSITLQFEILKWLEVEQGDSLVVKFFSL